MVIPSGKGMVEYRVILVEPKFQGNVGSVARTMKNFGLTRLTLVAPPTLGDEAMSRAMHAWDVVEAAQRVETFEEALRGCDFVVGTSGRIPEDEKSHLRNPIDVRELPPRLATMSGTVGLLFGREDFGLLNEELERCDLLVTIPTSTLYRSLNLSHAVAVVAYEIFRYAHPDAVKKVTPMSEEMKLTFQRHFDLLIDQLGLPEHKVLNTKRVYRKLLGRAVPSAWEYFVLMGIFSSVLRQYGIEIESGRWEASFDIPEGLEEELRQFLD